MWYWVTGHDSNRPTKPVLRRVHGHRLTGDDFVVASTLILIASAILFVYWFRYTCLLILSTRTARDYSRAVVEANGLSFQSVRNQLDETPDHVEAMDQVRASLDRDYQLVTYLLEHAVGCRPEGQEFEEWMLRLNYRIMRFAYSGVRRLSGAAARRVLLEMTSVINYLANAMGERMHAPAEA